MSPLLFSVYVDDLIRLLKQSGYGTYISSQFVRTILYADDNSVIWIMSWSAENFGHLFNSIIWPNMNTLFGVLFGPE